MTNMWLIGGEPAVVFLKLLGVAEIVTLGVVGLLVFVL